MSPSIPRIFFLLLLTACGTTLKPPPLPDGDSRHPINTSARINEYLDQNASSAPGVRPPQDERIAALEAHIAALHVLLAPPLDADQQTADGDTNGQGFVQTSPVILGLAPNEAIHFRSRSITFSIPFGVGDAGFAPSAPLRKLLLHAAAESPRIEVRGRTDADAFTPADRTVALRRAGAARAFLISHGIPMARIHATALARGAHIADNTTASGKARNRRVDIEVMDIDPTSHSIEVQTTEGEQHERD
jgi:outer membrane protein OmpA-like peptidoglycan-associated protein